MGVRQVAAAGRRLAETTLVDEAFLRDRAIVRDSSGGKKETWTERATAERARYVQVSDIEPTVALDSVFGRTSAVLMLKLGTEYKEGDRVRNPADGRIWVITRRLTPPSELAITERAGIAEVVT